MGSYKRMMEEAWDRGWSSAGDKWVCVDHLEDEALVRLVHEKATSTTCSYCARTSNEPFAAELDLVIERIARGLQLEWGNADDEGVPWEGGYVVETYDSWDLLIDVIESPLNHEELIRDVVGALPEHAWVRRDFALLPAHRRLQLSWEEFTNIVKHRRRYFFSDQPPENGDDLDVMAPAVMFELIGDVIRDVELLDTIPKGSRIFRIRADAQGRAFNSASDIGTAPLQYLRNSGRMAPAGLPIFYGAFDAATAEVEAKHANPSARSYSMGEFELRRDALVVDLSEAPEVPSLFDKLGGLRPAIRFLAFFANAISHPHKPDGRIHIEYVPTQVLTEWIRSRFDPETDDVLVGIKYASARHPEGKNVAFFIDNAGACDPPDDTPENEALLVLRDAWQVPPPSRSVMNVARERISAAYRVLREGQ